MTPTSKRGPGRSSTGRKAGSRPGSPRTSSKAKGKEPERSARFTTRAVVLLSVVLLLVASYTSSLHAWWNQRGEIQDRKAEIVMRKEAIKELQDDQERWSDRAFVQQQARERFGWVFPGEVGYRVIGSDGKIQGDVPTLDAPPVPKTRDWHDKLWGTVVEAGKEPKRRAPEPDPDAVLENE